MSRKLSTSRGIVLASLLTLGAVALAACTPPLPPDVQAALIDQHIVCEKGDTKISVPEDLAGVAAAVNTNMGSSCAGQTITEVGPNEAAPIKLFDQAPTPLQTEEFQKTCPAKIVVAPVFGYAVVLAFNNPDAQGLVLSNSLIAKILSGQITSWGDPALTAANGGTSLSADGALTVMSTTASSGPVAAMGAYLAKTAPADWKGGSAGTVSVGQHFPTQKALIDAMTAKTGSASVLTQVVSSAANFTAASMVVQGSDIAPDDTQLQKVGIGAIEYTTDAKGNVTAGPALGGVPNDKNFSASSAKIVLQQGQAMVGWPVMGIAHLMVCNNPADPAAFATAQFLIRQAGQGAFEAFGFTPLPEPVRYALFTPMELNKGLDSAAATAKSASPTHS